MFSCRYFGVLSRLGVLLHQFIYPIAGFPDFSADLHQRRACLVGNQVLERIALVILFCVSVGLEPFKNLVQTGFKLFVAADISIVFAHNAAPSRSQAARVWSAWHLCPRAAGRTNVFYRAEGRVAFCPASRLASAVLLWLRLTTTGSEEGSSDRASSFAPSVCA